MGDIIGGIGSIFGGNTAAKKDKEAANTALTGYNYLSNSPLIKSLTGNAATASNDVMQLLTSPNQDNPAFKNYLNSTGYNFQLGQGTAAITGSAAAKGLLDSGATAKALQGYGQGLAGQYFNNYLNALNGVTGQGLNAAQLVGQAGTTGGGNAGQFQQAAGQATANGMGGAFGSVANSLGSGSLAQFAPMALNFLGL